MVKGVLRSWSWALIACAGMVACSESRDEAYLTPGSGQVVRTRLASFMVDGKESALPGESGPYDMKAYLFEEGVLTRVYEDIKESDGSYHLSVDRPKGNLYLVANGEQGVPATGSLDEESWLETTIDMKDGQSRCFLTGRLALEEHAGSSVIPLTLRRGVARLDLHVDSVGIRIHQLRLKNVADRGFLFSGEEVLSPATVSLVDLDAGLSAPIDKTTRGLWYLYEQRNERLSVELSVSVGSQEPKRLTAALPSQIRRNAVYTLNVHPDGSGLGVKVDVLAWDYAEDMILYPDISRRLTIDEARSDIPAGVTLNEAGDQISMSHFETSFTVTVDCDNVLELVGLEKLPAGFRVYPVTSGVAGENTFRVEKKLMPIGLGEERFDLQFRRKGLNEVYPEDAIRFVMEENPTRLEGQMSFPMGDYAYKFGDYADGDFGVLEVPEGREVIIEVDQDEDRWMTVKSEGNRYRVVGGWRPNDPKADGREQSGRIVIRDIGVEVNPREEYTVVRKNYGLPVTLMNGVWWCKYNARGNSKDFEEQILVPDDPAVAAGKSLLDYLSECPVEDYLALWGWSYQGGNTQGLKVADVNGVVSHIGYVPAGTSNTNTLDPKTLAPTGYELPKIEYYNRIFKEWWMYIDRDGGPYHVQEAWEGNTQVFVASGVRSDIQVGTVLLPDTYHFEVYDRENGVKKESVTFYGPGSQWNNNGVNANKILFACYSSNSGWFNDNWGLRYNSGGPKDTRVVRFIKSPVEYMYGLDGE